MKFHQFQYALKNKDKSTLGTTTYLVSQLQQIASDICYPCCKIPIHSPSPLDRTKWLQLCELSVLCDGIESYVYT